MTGSNDSPKIYCQEDIKWAYNMGLKAGVDLLECMVGLSGPAQRLIFAELKKKIREGKFEPVLPSNGSGQTPL